MLATKNHMCAKCGRAVKNTETYAVVVAAYEKPSHKPELLLYRFHASMKNSAVMQNLEELAQDFRKQAGADYIVSMGQIEVDGVEMTAFTVLPKFEKLGSQDLVAVHFLYYQTILLDQVVEVMDDEWQFRDYFFAFPQLKKARVKT